MAGKKELCAGIAVFLVLVWGAGAYGDVLFGGTGGGPMINYVTVRVIEDGVLDEFEDPVPIEGAMVMVGLREGDPFDGNVGLTDADGYITFIDVALNGPQVVTAGAYGFEYFTLANVDAAWMIIPLKEYDPDEVTADVTGTWTGFSAVECDEKVQAGATIPTMTLADIMAFDIESFLLMNECLDLLGIIETPVPGALVIPPDKENPLTPGLCWLLGIPIAKPNYLAVVPQDTYQDIFSFAGEAEVAPLIDMFLTGEIDFGAIIAALDPMEIGIARDIYVDGPVVQNIDINTPLTANLTMSVDGTPAGTDVFLVSAGEINGDPAVAPGGGDLLFMGIGFTEGGAPGSDVVHTAPATGSFFDLRYIAAAVALGEDYNFSALVDRSDFVPPSSVTLDTFFSLVDLYAVEGAGFSYSDAYNPGVSADPALQVATLSLIVTEPAPPLPCEAAPTVDKKKTFWTVYGPGIDIDFELPQLPSDAPMYIPNPAGTPGDDLLEWTQFTFGMDLAGGFDFDSYDFDTFIETVTGVASNTTTFTFDSDGDGRAFPYDNCPTDYNPGQSDLDGDDIGDVCDADIDGDGYDGAVDDCDDYNPAINPGADEICSGGVDEDCDDLIDEADPDCDLDWLLELDGSYSGGVLSLNYTLTLPEAATWSNYLVLIEPSVQVIPLFSVPLPAIPIEYSLPISFPFPSLGTIGIYSGLFTAGGMEAFVLEWISTK